MSTSRAEYHFNINLSADWKVKVNSPNTAAVLRAMMAPVFTLMRPTGQIFNIHVDRNTHIARIIGSFMVQYGMPNIHVVETSRGALSGDKWNSFSFLFLEISVMTNGNHHLTYKPVHRNFPYFKSKEEAHNFSTDYCLKRNLVLKGEQETVVESILKHLRERDKVDEIPITKEMHDYLENLCAYELL